MSTQIEANGEGWVEDSQQRGCSRSADGGHDAYHAEYEGWRYSMGRGACVHDADATVPEKRKLRTACTEYQSWCAPLHSMRAETSLRGSPRVARGSQQMRRGPRGSPSPVPGCRNSRPPPGSARPAQFGPEKSPCAAFKLVV